MMLSDEGILSASVINNPHLLLPALYWPASLTCVTIFRWPIIRSRFSTEQQHSPLRWLLSRIENRLSTEYQCKTTALTHATETFP